MLLAAHALLARPAVSVLSSWVYFVQSQVLVHPTRELCDDGRRPAGLLFGQHLLLLFFDDLEHALPQLET